MKVAAVRVNDYNVQEVEQGLRDALGLLGGLAGWIKPGEKVLVKPNILEAVNQEKAVTTHPEVVRAVIRAVKNVGAIPVVGDSPGTTSTLNAAEKCGILAVCRQEGTELVPFNETIDIPFPEGLTIKKFTVARQLREADKVISLAKMKTHTFMGVTGATKNLFGFIVGMQKAQCHLRMQKRPEFAAMLADLANLVSPVLSIVDGVTGMEGNGPRSGVPVKAGVLLAGTNCFAVDVVMAEMMGFDAGQVPLTALAIERELTAPLSGIEIIGSGQDCRMSFAKPRTLNALEDRIPKWLAKLASSQLTAHPTIEPHCIGCGRCAAHCPSKAMAIRDDRVYIDYAKCIRCYCCQELCPENAVCLEDGHILKLVRRFL